MTRQSSRLQRTFCAAILSDPHHCRPAFDRVVADFQRLLGLVTCARTFEEPFSHVGTRGALERRDDAAWMVEYLGSLGLAPSTAEGWNQQPATRVASESQESEGWHDRPSHAF